MRRIGIVCKTTLPYDSPLQLPRLLSPDWLTSSQAYHALDQVGDRDALATSIGKARTLKRKRQKRKPHQNGQCSQFLLRQAHSCIHRGGHPPASPSPSTDTSIQAPTRHLIARQTQTQPATSCDSLSGGEIAGIIIGSIVGILILIYLFMGLNKGKDGIGGGRGATLLSYSSDHGGSRRKRSRSTSGGTETVYVEKVRRPRRARTRGY